MKDNRFYILFMMILTIAAAAAMILLPRSTVSVQERRTLNEFPEFSFASLASGDYTKAISEWFADTVPERDRVTEASLAVEEMLGSQRQSDETYRFYGVEMAAVNDEDDTAETASDEQVIKAAAVQVSDADNPDVPGPSADEGKEAAEEGTLVSEKKDASDAVSKTAGNNTSASEKDEASDDGSKTTGNNTSASEKDAPSDADGEKAENDTPSAEKDAASDAGGETADNNTSASEKDEASVSSEENRQIAEAEAVPPDEAFTVASNGIVIIGSGENTRAIMMYGGSKEVTTRYAETVNKYHELMPSLNVYCMVIPTAVSFYLPSNLSGYTGSQLTQINNVMEHLAPGVHGIDAYTILGQHRDEPIYLRTDHHWAPLGAYYAASKVAEAAGLPFLDLSAYDEYRLHNYVGTMYMYSNDISVKNNPEDFVYYIPRDVGLSTTYINYKLDSKWNVIGKSDPIEGSFFQKRKDGDSDAYCTFMGGDAKITQVKTTTANGRKLIILKDSYGNALPAFLFGSFEEIHVIDSRYFKENIIQYIEEHGITDLLFANNAFHASTKSTVNAYDRYLTQ